MDRQTDSQARRSGGRGAAVVYFAKAPLPGRVKTRLVPPLTAHEAAALYGAFIRRSVATIDGARTLLYGWPAEELGLLRALVPADVEVRAQRGRDLWERMASCMRELFDEGHRPVVIRNTDSPDLPVARVEQALARCTAGTVVLGPDRGGGYYLVALHAPAAALFAGADAGSEAVCAQTERRAHELGLRVVKLAVEPDVDTFDDLLAMWRTRLDDGGPGPAAETRA